MAELTPLDEKLAEVLGLAQAAQAATTHVAKMDGAEEYKAELDRMSAQAQETEERTDDDRRNRRPPRGDRPPTGDRRPPRGGPGGPGGPRAAGPGRSEAPSDGSDKPAEAAGTAAPGGAAPGAPRSTAAKRVRKAVPPGSAGGKGE